MPSTKYRLNSIYQALPIMYTLIVTALRDKSADKTIKPICAARQNIDNTKSANSQRFVLAEHFKGYFNNGLTRYELIICENQSMTPVVAPLSNSDKQNLR